MKKILLALILLAAGINLNAQKLETKNLPAPVVAKFNVFYPDAKNVIWEKTDKDYEAHFKDVDSRKVSVLFNADGSLTAKKWKASKDDLTDEVAETIKRRFKDYKIVEVEKVEKGGFLFYEVELAKKENGAKVIQKAYFTDYGQLVSSEVKK